jgi:hypothetical protein
MNDNTFNGAFAKAFPERVAANIERVALQKAALIARDPFGGEALEKAVHHHFKDSDRVEIDASNHRSRGAKGVIKDDRNDSHLEILLDSGHTVFCTAEDIKPEDFPNAAAVASEKIRKAALHNPMIVEDESDVLAKRADGSEDPVPAIVESLKRGESVALPGRLRKTCEKYPLLQKLISADKIRFQEKMYY